MRSEVTKLWNLFSDQNRSERVQNLLEINLNRLLYNRKPEVANTYEEFLGTVAHRYPELFALLSPSGEAEEAVQWVRSEFNRFARGKRLPFPSYYNADKSFAILCYALVRFLKPRLVIETGVGYGMTSATILLAMERNSIGNLISIDLPPLSDPRGTFIGIAVQEHFRQRWTLRFGRGRSVLPQVLNTKVDLGLFVSDSANVYTMQRYEFLIAWSKLQPMGACLFNNISYKFQQFLSSIPDTQYYSIRQLEKPSCVTGLILKR